MKTLIKIFLGFCAALALLMMAGVIHDLIIW